MSKSRILLIIAALTALATLATTSGANAAITWPTSNLRTKEQPRTWNNNGSVVGDRISGSHYSGVNQTAVSNNGAVNYLHAVQVTDGAGGAVDWNNVPGRTFAFPYFGAGVAYGGNDANITNVNAAFPYWDGDCGVMRPHAFTDDFGKYAGAWTPETMTGGSATIGAGGVLNLTDDQVANFDKIEVGDRIQTGAGTAYVPRVFNRTATGAGTVSTNTDPITNAPYWRVTATPNWNQIQATPDVATAQPTTAVSWAGGSATYTSSRGGVNQFQGVQVGQRVTIAGLAPAGLNGNFIVATAAVATPYRFTVLMADPGAITDQVGTVTRQTDNYMTHAITAASAAGTTATFTTANNPHGLVAGETVIISGMTPVAYNNGGVAVTVAAPITATQFNAVLSAAPGGIGTAFGMASVNTATATTQGTLQRGSDCQHVTYERSTDGGLTWDGGGSAVVSPCAAGITCGSVNAFNIAGGGTNGGVKTYLSEMHTTGAQVETYNQYVFVLFFSSNGGIEQYPSDQCPNDPMIAYVRVNSSYGAWNSWSAPVRVTPSGGQTMYPNLAVDKATGNLYLASIDAANGRVIVYKSTNQGTSWDAGTHVEHTNFVGTTGFLPPSDVNGNDYPQCSNAARSTPDSVGYGNPYGPIVKIAVHNNNVGLAWVKNALGNKIVAAVSTNGGTSYTSNIHLAAVGAGGALCPGWGCYTMGETNCPYDYASAICYDDTNGIYNLAVAAGPLPAATPGSRIGFAWVNDGGWAKTAGSFTTMPRGLYYKQVNVTAGPTVTWGADKLVSCMMGTPQGPMRIGPVASKLTLTTGTLRTNTMTTKTITAVTSTPHGLAATDFVRINGAIGTISGAMNGDWDVGTVDSTTQITITQDAAGVALGDTSAGTLVNTPTGGFDPVATLSRYSSAPTADPCIGATAATTQMDFYRPQLDMFGTTGIGVVFGGCKVNLATGAPPLSLVPCQTGADDLGDEILYKESGNAGVGWGAEWGCAGPCPIKVVASAPLAAQSYGDADIWRDSKNPDLIMDNQTDSTSGCTGQQSNGAPITGCTRYVFFIGASDGANPNYNNSYVQFIFRGVQT